MSSKKAEHPNTLLQRKHPTFLAAIVSWLKNTDSLLGLASKCYRNLLYFVAKMHFEFCKAATLPNMGLFYESLN